MQRRHILASTVILCCVPFLAAPSYDWDDKTPEPTIYPGFFFDQATGKPMGEVWIYVDIPGDNQFKLDSRFLTNSRGIGGKLFENKAYNFYWSKNKYDKAVVEDKLKEEHCFNHKTAEKDGKLPVKLPKLERVLPGDS